MARFEKGHKKLGGYSFPEGHTPWNKGLNGYNNGHINYHPFEIGNPWRFKPGKEHRYWGKYDEESPNWKADKVGNEGLHKWLKQHLPKPDLCQDCNIKSAYDLANITGVYTRDFSNWKYLCRGCHMKLDYANGIRK